MHVITALLVLVGLINFAPVVGIMGASKLNEAYGLSLISDDLILLMRHRALLFGILGAFILYAAFAPQYQNAAIVMGLISMAAFVVLMLLGEGNNAALKKIMWIDVAGVVLVLAAGVIKWKVS